MQKLLSLDFVSEIRRTLFRPTTTSYCFRTSFFPTAISGNSNLFSSPTSQSHHTLSLLSSCRSNSDLREKIYGSFLNPVYFSRFASSAYLNGSIKSLANSRAQFLVHNGQAKGLKSTRHWPLIAVAGGHGPRDSQRMG
ncbi:hypothetical protein Nepgr_023745 [Nepenthes gracilis]|uniref:Uncharacterized protein n=1 Tax=Nepenthes gracilis TaxID=150966 RepID=A0AAD3T4G7_NEPGR|nr:hypothetical protein Nepgr_023745 [Nepenthes gracilis]